MDELANPSNASNQMFLFFLSVGWRVVDYATADAYVFIRIKMGSWPPSLNYDRLSREASQTPTRADASPTSMSAADTRNEGRRATVIGRAAALCIPFSGSPP